MRTGEDEDAPLSRARLRQLVIGVLTAIVVIAALLPWLAVADAWRTVGSDDYIADPGIGRMPRLAVAVQALPFISLQAGDYGVLAMGAAVGVILLTRTRSGEPEDGMRWSPVQVLTAGAVVVALLAALLRLVMSVYTELGLTGEGIDQYLMRTGGAGTLMVILAPLAPVLGWVAVILTGLLYRPAEAEPAEETAAESESEEPTPVRRRPPRSGCRHGSDRSIRPRSERTEARTAAMTIFGSGGSARPRQGRGRWVGLAA